MTSSSRAARTDRTVVVLLTGTRFCWAGLWAAGCPSGPHPDTGPGPGPAACSGLWTSQPNTGSSPEPGPDRFCCSDRSPTAGPPGTPAVSSLQVTSSQVRAQVGTISRPSEVQTRTQSPCSGWNRQHPPVHAAATEPHPN